MKNLKNINLLGIIFSIIGLAICVILIREFHGNAGELVSSLCSATGSGDSCKQVAESNWSGFRDVPFFGSIPVALIGFVYYGFSGFLFYNLYKENDEDKKKSFLYFLLSISILAILVDLFLLFISITQIGTVCLFCAITYILTSAILILIYLQVKSMKSEKSTFTNIRESIPKNISSNFLNYTIVVLFFFSCGLGVGKLSENKSETPLASTDPEKQKAYLQAQIDEFNKKPELSLNVSEAPSIGPKNASVKIVKFADFNCGHCMHASKILSQVMAENPNDVIVYYKNFPLDGNCNYLVDRKTPTASSCVAATAALCANKQNKFKEMYHGLYEDLEIGNHHSVQSVLSLASKNSLDMGKFKTCMGSEEIKNFINREVKDGEKMKIESTPSLFVNNRALTPGTPNETFLNGLIKDIISKKK